MRKFGLRFGCVAATLVVGGLLVGSSFAAKATITLAGEDIPGVDAEGNLACDPVNEPHVLPEFAGTGDVTLSVNTKNGKARIKIKGTAVNGTPKAVKFKDSPDVLECTLAILGLNELPAGVTIDHTLYVVGKPKGATAKVKGNAKGRVDPALLGGL